MSGAAERGRIHSLDGLRALSIALVFVYHLTGTPGFPLRSEEQVKIDLGNFGVVVFFVISGFLITTLLLGELDRKGSISLGRFYFRRTARIFPTYYAYLFVCCALAALNVVAIPLRDLVTGVTYTSNYSRPVWLLKHTWSLSVEEQFYLMWPATLWLLGKRRALHAALGFVLLAPVFRVLFWRHGHYNGAFFPCVGDSIAVGCLLAGWRDALETNPRYRALLRPRTFFIVPLLLVVTLWLRRRIFLSLLLFQSAENVLIALCLHYCLTNEGGPLRTFLNSKPLVYIGGLSYSLYLFQEPFLWADGGTRWNAFPLNLVAAIALGVVAHSVIEKPALAWRARYERRRDVS